MISQEEKISVIQPLTLEDRRSFLRLPLAERRQKLAEQAEYMIEHYNSKLVSEERERWQGGDIVEQ